MKVDNIAFNPPRSKRRSSSKPTKVRGREGVKGVRTKICVTINRSADDLFAFWRNFENLPRIMDHIESIGCKDANRSHWRARRLKDETGDPIEWDSEVINERPQEMIAWRTVEGSDLRHAGSIWFTPAPDGIETEVRLELMYEAGGFTDFLAKLVRRSPAQQMHEDLRHFKQLMETGEIPTTAGQPASRTKDTVAKYEEAK